MKLSAVEERLSVLEQQVAELKAAVANGVRKKDWRRTIGMFTGDEVMKRIDEEALKFREADRAKARRRYARTRKSTNQA